MGVSEASSMGKRNSAGGATALTENAAPNDSCQSLAVISLIMSLLNKVEVKHSSSNAHDAQTTSAARSLVTPCTNNMAVGKRMHREDCGEIEILLEKPRKIVQIF